MFYERSQKAALSYEPKLLAACSMLVAAKSGELDERIPFISKLKKYTSLYMSTEDFKKAEVAIAECLDWDIQKFTFYSFIETYLSAGLVIPQDKVSKSLLSSLSLNGIDNTVRMLVKEETSDARSLKIRRANSYRGIECTQEETDLYSSIQDQFSDVGNLSDTMRNNLIKTFEFYVKDLCNLVLEDFEYWNCEKKSLAISIVLYARSAMFDPTSTW